MSMMCYYLLRNNKESGPFTLKELKEMPLLTSDLIWINGESTCWKSPDEIEELRGLPKEPQAVKQHVIAKSPATLPAAYTATTNRSLPSLSAPDQPATGEEAFAGESLQKPSFEALKRKYASRAPRKKIWKSQINIGANLIGIATLVIGVSVAAFMIKKAVDNIEPGPIFATAEAVEIGSAETHMNTSSQAALAPLAAVAAVSQSNTTVERQTNLPPAVETEQKKIEIALPAPPQVMIKDEVKEGANNDLLTERVPEKGKTTQDEKTEVKEPAEEKPASAEMSGENKEPDEKKKSKPALQLSANEYKVGFLGGVSNLELSVTNLSSQAIRKAEVVVEYLKPNGKVVSTQTVEVPGLQPGTSKKIPVPDNGRGVSVRYKVVNIEN
jgi:hypothetical protein